MVNRHQMGHHGREVELFPGHIVDKEQLAVAAFAALYTSGDDGS